MKDHVGAMYVQVMQIRADSRSEVVWQTICSYSSHLPIIARGSRPTKATITLAHLGLLDLHPRNGYNDCYSY